MNRISILCIAALFFIGCVPISQLSHEGSGTPGWKTYQSKKYGFEIQYPPDWEATQTLTVNDVASEQSVFLVGAPDIFVHISVREEPLNVELETSEKSLKQEDITINNAHGIKLTSGNPYNDCQSFTYLFQKGKNIYVVPYVQCPTHSDNKIFRDIANSFRFIDTTDVDKKSVDETVNQLSASEKAYVIAGCSTGVDPFKTVEVPAQFAIEEEALAKCHPNRTPDINGDGHVDLIVPVEFYASNVGYGIWIYQMEGNYYKGYGSILGDEPPVTYGDGTLSTTYKAGGDDWSTSTYKLADGKLEQVGSTETVSPEKILLDTDDKWLTFNDTAQGITFRYPDIHTTETHIHFMQWPPIVSSAPGIFTCEEGVMSGNFEGGTRKKVVVNGDTLCRENTGGPAAGSVYSKFEYRLARDANIISVSFGFQLVQCANYDEPNLSTCHAEQRAFDNLDLDDIADQIAQSFKVITK